MTRRSSRHRGGPADHPPHRLGAVQRRLHRLPHPRLGPEVQLRLHRRRASRRTPSSSSTSPSRTATTSGAAGMPHGVEQQPAPALHRRGVHQLRRHVPHPLGRRRRAGRVRQPRRRHHLRADVDLPRVHQRGARRRSAAHGARSGRHRRHHLGAVGARGGRVGTACTSPRTTGWSTPWPATSCPRTSPLIKPMKQEYIDELTRYRPRRCAAASPARRRRYGRARSCARASGRRRRAEPVIGYGMSEDRRAVPRLHEPHSFNVAWLRATPGEGMLRHRHDGDPDLLGQVRPLGGDAQPGRRGAARGTGPQDMLSVPPGVASVRAARGRRRRPPNRGSASCSSSTAVTAAYASSGRPRSSRPRSTPAGCSTRTATWPGRRPGHRHRGRLSGAVTTDPGRSGGRMRDRRPGSTTRTPDRRARRGRGPGAQLIVAARARHARLRLPRHREAAQCAPKRSTGRP